MEINYERKFQEMKNYIPFLENMIERLEKMHSPRNPRQAQLDKIRSLRDLLLDNRKRMKMDNLLKCEQVLLNLYSKVEQGTSPTTIQRDTISESRTTNLSVVRNKLKSVVSKLHTSVDTLPEIARASEMEETFARNHFMEHHIPGSKEPALFQRRPRNPSSTRSLSPSRKTNFLSVSTSNEYMREYTDEKALFVRRSPKKSPRIISSSYQSYQTKDYKKYLEDVNVSQLKDLNITLKVPEDSLHSLNTKDIVSRIINCSDNDVDIDTLRGLRTQILGELKETGSKDDISDIILKSYKNQVAKKKKSEEVEEGELSDSESEAIESIYSGLVNMNKDKSNKIVKSESSDKSKPCKIQICLVINPEKQKENAPLEQRKINMNLDLSDFESFENVDKENKTLENDKSTNTQTQHDLVNAIPKQTAEVVTTEKKMLRNETSQTETNEQPNQADSHTLHGINSISIDRSGFNSNKSVSEDVHSEKVQEKDRKPLKQHKSSPETAHDDSNNFKDSNNKHDVEIPLLNSQKTQLNSSSCSTNEVSEIEILQALKNEILSETCNVLSSDIEAPLFQPKLSKVANAEEVGYKKKISIENYKAKATPKSVPNFGFGTGSKDDILKKQSLKLTEKECERFFSSNVSFDSLSDDEDKSDLSVDDLYENLAPKSPDHDDFADTGLKPPVIIPVDPVEMPVIISEKDIDMRKILPQDAGNNVTPSPILPEKANVFNNEGKLLNKSVLQVSNLGDPRMVREVPILNSHHSNNPFNPVKPLIENFASNFNQTMPINITGPNHDMIGSLPPNRTAVSLSPSFIPNLTPNRIQNIGGNITQNTQNNSISFDSTPSRNSFENEDDVLNNHVYTTIYQNFESQVYNDKPRRSRWSSDNKIPFWKDIDVPRNNQNKITIWENQVDPRNSSNTFPNWEDGYSRKPSKMPSHNEYMPTYDRYNVEARDPYIRDDCPAASRHSFRRVDGHPATITSFSRLPTTTHPFGRQEQSMTSSHSFGGSNYTPTAFAQKFSKPQDRRLYRSSDYDIYHGLDRNRERYINYQSKFNSISQESDQCNRFNRSDSYRQNGSNDRNKFYENNDSSYREQVTRRKTADYQPYNRERDGNRLFTRNRGISSSYAHRHLNESNSYDKRKQRSHHYERSATRNKTDSSPSLSQLPSTVGSVTPNDKKVEVHSYSGYTHSIDSSSNNSIIETKKGDEPKFDARRQRASSVGRSITRHLTGGRGVHMSKQSLNMPESVTARKSFQRSSSVGREISDGASNFKDIKESLKSFKLKSDSKVSMFIEKTEESDKLSPIVDSCDSSHKREIYDSRKRSLNSNVKYLPRRNNRDPRMCRDSNEINNKFSDKKKNDSRDSKHCGIVYTNDNITKGIILGSGYGVKNYKIPKIKRNNEVSESIISDSIPGNEIKDNTENDCHKAAKTREVKNKSHPELSQQHLTKDVKLSSGDQENTKDNHETLISTITKPSDIERDSEKVSNNKRQLKEDKHILVPEISIAHGKRLTRSATKNASTEKNLTETSCIQTTTKQRKAFVFGSNSDENDINKSITKNDSTEDTNETVIENPDVKTSKSLLGAVYTESFNVTHGQSEKIDTGEIQGQGLLGSCIQSNQNLNNNLKPVCNPSDKERKSEIINSSFGIDDLDIFSDNVISDPGIDNINKLLVDLDNDLDSAKNLELDNTDFTKDVTFGTVLENTSTPCKERNNLNICENEIVQDKNATATAVAIDDKDTFLKISSNINTLGTSLVITRNEKEILSSKEDKQESDLDVSSSQEGLYLDDTLCKQNNEKNIPQKKMIQDDAFKNQGFISTSYNQPHDETNLVNSSEICKKFTNDGDNLKKPDSTIKNSVTKLDGNCPDMTNKPIKDMMNCDIFTGQNNCNINTNISEPSSSGTNKTEIESIGKLLSILQDKSKIKELLGLLGYESSRCEKIKKKLEKLSEIVSDDEEIDNEDTKRSKQQDSQNNVSVDEMQLKNQEHSKIVNCPNKSTDNDNDVEAVEECNNLESQREMPSTLSINKEVSEVPSNIETVNKEKEEQIPLENNLKTDNKKVLIPKNRKKKTFIKKNISEDKRSTRSDGAELKIDIPILKKPSRELKKLQEDIRDMFIGDDVLNSTGIRMCRIAKLVDGKAKGAENEKINKMAKTSKTKPKESNIDPYDFETDSINGTNIPSHKNDSLGSDVEFLESSKTFGSNQLVTEIKKTKRRRRNGWKSGIIKSKSRRKIVNQKHEITPEKESETPIVDITIPDLNCYIDKKYCFRKKYTIYECRLCDFKCHKIVKHYKKHHPGSEIPCSRMSPVVAKSAITESVEVNIRAISKITPKKYICRFCFKEFKPLIESFFWHIVSVHTGEYKRPCLESAVVNDSQFVLDIPQAPTKAKGQLLGYICGKCNYTQISLENLISHIILRHDDDVTTIYNINLAALTRPYINILLKKVEITKKSVTEERIQTKTSRVLRNFRSNSRFTETIDLESNSMAESKQNQNVSLLCSERDDSNENTNTTKNIPSEIVTEIDKLGDMSHNKKRPILQIESDTNNTSGIESEKDCSLIEPVLNSIDKNPENYVNNENKDLSECPKDVLDCPHFKIKYNKSGSKEYICCINGNKHYRTTLLISFKKHVEFKHTEKWDGFCYVCKVIVTPQGTHFFKDCLSHFLDKHVDNFPILEETAEEASNIEPTIVTENQPTSVIKTQPTIVTEKQSTNVTENQTTLVGQGPKPFINVRPISELVLDSDNDNSVVSDISKTSVLPIMENVASLGSSIESPRPSPSYPSTSNHSVPFKKLFKYEEVQAEMMTKKQRVILDIMMSENKLGHVFKCSGRFCSFTTDSPEDALLHASAHSRLGGEDALNCVYCDFDCQQNSIQLVTHVFKNHGNCQYICGKCFYRAAASLLVKAHFKRVHDASTSVTILRTAFKITYDEETILAREVAVPHYVCAEDNSEGTCGFKTYTPGKFCEHLQSRHALDTDFKCFICATKVAAPADLVRHLKSHGFKLYQCCWCVHGADTETELLAHASAYHPTKLPKTYLRIITNKEGQSDLRVLPLAHLTKPIVGVKDIIMSKVEDNPEEEARRAIELEKVLKQNKLFLESMVSSVEANTQQEDLNLSFDNKAEVKPLGSNNASTLTTVQPEFTPLSVANDFHCTNEQKTSNILELLNSEKAVETVPVIYILDSDEDNSPIESNNTTSSKEIKVPLKNLFLCPKCKTVLNTGIGMKRHMMWCYVSIPDPISCAHCSVTLNKSEIVDHYYEVHSLEGKPGKLICSKCHLEFKSAYLLKEHRKLEHSNTAIKTTGGMLSSGVKEVEIQNKRKRSLGTKENPETPEKIRRYGPQDVNLLPINPILDDLVFCSLCEFKTKVKLNMVRHLQLHAEQQPVPQTAPVNPVPHLETNEKHFDKMVNLASSSVVTRTSDKNKPENITVILPPDALSGFPKYVPEKHRLTCGAKGCSYISVDESMLKCHWETLHDGSNEFHCVHCPPQQYLDVSQPLTSCRIIAHLKMHDSQLYACSLCTYYHHNREVVQKHLVDTHKGGQVMVVREEVVTNTTTNPVQNTAPTMDLKPWQCGLCSFKSLRQPEVVEHCAKEHNSKMQYKCAYCAFRTSNVENVTKHQSKSHPDQAEEIFYYYYREGTVPDDPDGTQKWQKQRQKNNIIVPQLKSEPTNNDIPSLQPLLKPIITTVNLNLVKKELIVPIEDKLEDLCNEFGEFCDPNGLKYKCPLCTNEMEDDIETIQSHLFEELKYRKWGCSICSYKAFHKVGLSEHMQVEHCQNREPIALEIDYRIETWVNKLLEYQTSLIQMYKDNLLIQKAEIFRVTLENSKVKPQQNELPQTATKSNNSSISVDELNKIFGTFGASVNRSYCCPKCNATFENEDLMQNHLESELNKIRWFCSGCYVTFQTFHEAQFHCRSAHAALRPAARPCEAPRDPSARDAWVQGVLKVQRLSIADEPKTQPDLMKDSRIDESLLVVRYEENIPTPDINLPQAPIPTDSDEEKLVIDESVEKRILTSRNCTFCGHLIPRRPQMRSHILKHYNLKPFVCGYCSFNGTKASVANHHKRMHVPKPLLVMMTPIPNIPPLEYAKKHTSNVKIVTCLVCKNSVIESEIKNHLHPNEIVSFAEKGDVVIKCIVCSKLSKELQLHLLHHQKHHPKMENNYITTKFDPDEEKEKPYYCKKCEKTFLLLKELRAHSKTNCCGTSKMPVVSINKTKMDVGNNVSRKRKNKDNSIDSEKKIAKKSTTSSQNDTMARKSTTRLPSDTQPNGEASCLNSNKSIENATATKTMKPLCRRLVPVTSNQVKTININPVVVVERIKMEPNY